MSYIYLLLIFCLLLKQYSNASTKTYTCIALAEICFEPYLLVTANTLISLLYLFYFCYFFVCAFRANVTSPTICTRMVLHCAVTPLFQVKKEVGTVFKNMFNPINSLCLSHVHNLSFDACRRLLFIIFVLYDTATESWGILFYHCASFLPSVHPNCSLCWVFVKILKGCMGSGSGFDVY